MKKTVTYLFVVFLAALVFYGGAGVNFVTYCCGECRTECVAVKDACSCCHANEEDACCDVEYVSFDWNVFYGHLFNLQPVAIDLVSLAGSPLSLLPVSFVRGAGEIKRESPPGYNYGIYLSLLTILLI